MTFDKNNYDETFVKFDDAITALELDIGAVFDPVAPNKNSEMYQRFCENLNYEFSEQNMNYLTFDAIMIPYLYKLKSRYGKMLLEIFPGFTGQVGRAKKHLSEDDFFSLRHECAHAFPKNKYNNFAKTNLIIDENGNVFLDCCCIDVNLSIGNINNYSLKKILMRRDILHKYLPGKIMMNCDNEKMSCTLCAKVARQNFQLE